MKVDEHAVLTKIVRYSLRAAPSPHRDALRRFVAESAELERKRDRQEGRARQAAIEALPICVIHSCSLATCDCL